MELQDIFYKKLIGQKILVEFSMRNNGIYTLRAFDKFTLLVETDAGDTHLLYKTFIAYVIPLAQPKELITEIVDTANKPKTVKPPKPKFNKPSGPSVIVKKRRDYTPQ